MKKTILCLTATILTLFGCNQSNTSTSSNKTTNQEQQKPKTISIEEIEAEQLKSGIRQVDIIEGMFFGMTQKQVTKVLNQLKKDKKVKKFAANDDGNQILADYNIGVSDYTASGLMDLRFYHNELFLCQIYFKEKLNKSLYTLSEDFLKLFEKSLGEHQYKKSGMTGTSYFWITGNRSISIGDLQDPNDPYYMIEYKDTGRYSEAMKTQQENIDKQKPKI